jgi:hypothetical protein
VEKEQHDQGSQPLIWSQHSALEKRLRAWQQVYLEIFPLEGEEQHFQLFPWQWQPQVVHVCQRQRPLASCKLEALLLHHQFKQHMIPGANQPWLLKDLIHTHGLTVQCIHPKDGNLQWNYITSLSKYRSQQYGKSYFNVFMASLH